MSRTKYIIRNRNPLAAWCTLEGADQFVQVKATSTLDIWELAERQKDLYATISKAIDNGYRTTDDDLVRGVLTILEGFCNPLDSISYIGKANMQIKLPNTECKRLLDEMRAIKELLQHPLDIEWDSRGVIVEAPVTKEKRDDKRGRRRSIPVVSHCFQQVRPLAVKYLRAERDSRETMWQVWMSKRKIDMTWSY